MAKIPVPKTPKTAYNPNRAPGTLLQNQLEHLEWVIRPAAERTPEKFDFTPATTEGEAATRIQQLMLELHRQTTGRTPIAQLGSAKPTRSTGRAKRASKPKPRHHASH